MPEISPARRVAAITLLTVSAEPLAQANEVLGRQAMQQRLRPDDARLARTIVFGVLRHALTLDYYYAPYLKQPADRLDVRLRTLLRMAAYQKFFLSKVPDYAIGNEMVELGKTAFKMKPPQVGFLNAVLRKIVSAEAPPALPAGNRVNDLAVRYSFPPYLAGLFVGKYGTHKAIAIMEACNEEAPMTIRVNTLVRDTDALAQELTESEFLVKPGLLAPEALIVAPGTDGRSLFESDAFVNGAFYVQDEGSQLVAHLVAPVAGERILDMCSAPGGKSTHMAELTKGEAQITATDFSTERLKLVEENVARLGTPGIMVRPLEEVLSGSEQFDAVLVDAPCSGMGTIRRNPEIRYRISAEELARQAERQRGVLEQAAPLVRPGGRLIYSTCSMSEVENQQEISAFLREHPEFAVKARTEDAEAGTIAGLQRPDGFFATWPAYPALDGFEAVVLLRQ